MEQAVIEKTRKERPAHRLKCKPPSEILKSLRPRYPPVTHPYTPTHCPASCCHALSVILSTCFGTAIPLPPHNGQYVVPPPKPAGPLPSPSPLRVGTRCPSPWPLQTMLIPYRTCKSRHSTRLFGIPGHRLTLQGRSRINRHPSHIMSTSWARAVPSILFRKRKHTRVQASVEPRLTTAQSV